MPSLLDASTEAVMFAGSGNNNNSNNSTTGSTSASAINSSVVSNTTSNHSDNGNATINSLDVPATSDQPAAAMTKIPQESGTSYPKEHLRVNTAAVNVDNTGGDHIVPHPPPVTPDDIHTNLTSVKDLLTVTLHLSSASSAVNLDKSSHHATSSLLQPTEFVRVILIPVSGLEQREEEMVQTARSLQIPTSRWNGSLLYNLYQQQKLEQGNDSRRITLHLYQDTNWKWSTAASINSNEIDDNAATFLPEKATATSSVSSIWFGTCLHKNIDLDWIQEYYVTGLISIPSNARGYDILWLLEYFQLMYQPDQFHFANYATYSRVQLWSKYYCYLRPKLMDWMLQEINHQQQQYQQQHSQEKEPPNSMFPLLFGTMSSNEMSVELGTERLLPLGDVTVVPISNTSTSGRSSSKRTLADRALKLFNTSHVETHNNNNNSKPQHNKHSSGTRSCTDETQSQTTVPCPEELTATEIRNDFCRFLKYRLCENDSSGNHNLNWNVQFTVRPVTVHYNYEYRTKDTTNSNSSNGSTPVTNGSAEHSESAGNKVVVHQRYLVAHRAVLVIDAQPHQPLLLPQPTPPVKLCRSKSDFSAPVDELVEEEIAKGRLEGLLQQVATQGNKLNVKHDRRVTINETLSFEKEKSVRTNEESKSFDTTINNQKSIDMLDLNAPDDELNASFDNGNCSFNASIGVFPLAAMKKKKKPKPVFVLPDKLLDVDNTEVPQLARMKVPIVKTSPMIGTKQNDDLALPGPITIVRKGTFDNTVTSALTGPFYIDENGILRDVFENCDPDSDEDFEGDEDTRAQARRHEWIQTALLNRGIGERMETLLKEDKDKNASGTPTSFDPWDWITGLNVCELSREVIKSVEHYANCVLCESAGGVNQKSSPNDAAASIKIASSGEKVAAKTVLVSRDETESNDVDHVGDIKRPVFSGTQDHQSGEEDHFEHIVENIVFTSEIDDKDGSVESQGSQESPRGVQRFDSASSADKLCAEPVAFTQIDASAPQIVCEDTVAPKHSEKKIRGIKGLFRRKRVDSSGV